MEPKNNPDKQFLWRLRRNLLEARNKKQREIKLPVYVWRRLEQLMGATDAQLRGWDMVRRDLENAYPVNIDAAIQCYVKACKNVGVGQ